MAEDNAEGPILEIPQVPKHWFVGNLPDVDPAFAAKSYWHLAELYGPIFKLDLVGTELIIVSNYELMKDVTDDDRFEKKQHPVGLELRNIIGDGLFTAHNYEPNWWKAHRILMPVFGPMGVRKMFDEQMDIASQMILKWDRYGPDNEIVCADDFTRLAFDTIGFCSFNYRFNEFYADHIHPFAQQMADSLKESGLRANRTRLNAALHPQAEKKYWQDIAAQHKLCDDVLDERLKNPQPEINDLLNVMLHTADPETGEKLDRENIRNNMATFLIAGHETTSGTLSFLFYFLLKNPETYHRAQQEVDEVVGLDALTVEHVSKLKYVDACVKETLRYCGPITINSRGAKETCFIGNREGRYEIKPDQRVILNLKNIHHDRCVWGDDVDEFKPERMLHFENIPDGAWKPFGTGMRACIGRAFAEQEILINVALILQRFQVEMVDPLYKLEFISTLTIKPKDFKIRVRRRPGRSMHVGLYGDIHEHKEQHATEKQDTGKSLLVLYGSNAGTCQAYAEELASRASQSGINVETKTLNSVVERLPTDRPVAIITPSYEGKPPDNAKKFVTWLETHKDSNVLKGVNYFVFGVGNHEWTASYHKVPKQVDALMARMGAHRMMDAMFVDVENDTMGPFEDWCDKVKEVLGGDTTSQARTLKANISKGTTTQSLTNFGSHTGTVKKNMILADNSVGPAKMHMEVELPEDVTYQTGDYLVVLPHNHRDDTRRVESVFSLESDDLIQITETRKDFLKSDTPFTVYDLIASRVELSTPATQRQLRYLAEHTTDSEQKAEIVEMADARWEETLKKRFSILDVLEDHPSCKIEFEDYLDMLKPLTPRPYSISSTMLGHNTEVERAVASITYDVTDTQAWSGHGRSFHGVSSSYLADLKVGNTIRCAARPTHGGFHLPKDFSVPVILICSGTGIAPMRGFIEERAAIQEARGIKLGPALLYFGCRDIDHDYIYRDQLEAWEKQGVVSLRPCFSKQGPKENNFKYTSDRIYAEKEEIRSLFSKGAKIFICGSANKIARSTAETCKKIWMEVHTDKTLEDADKWLDSIKEDRYVSDVFG